ncbi:MAG: lytic transglycosylase domain-containing protein [Lachnospiraceae bacterium]
MGQEVFLEIIIGREVRLVSTIQVIDGRYFVTEDTAVSGADSAGSAASVSFDSVFNSKTDELSLESIFQKMADKYDVPLDLLKAVAKVESDFRMDVVSKSGAVGVMQLMPRTAEALGVTNIYDPEQNIEGGAKYLAGAIDYFNGDVALAVAAYNAGYGAVERAGGIPPYEQTQNYVKKIYDVLSAGSGTDLSGISFYQKGTYTPAETDVVGTVTVPQTSALALTDTDSVLSDLSDTLKSMYSIVLGRNVNGQEMTLTEYISYENYMRLLDEFNEILQRVCFQDGDNDSDNQLSSNSDDSDLSALYEATSSLYSARAQSLLKL